MSSEDVHFIAEKSLTLLKALLVLAAVMVACTIAPPAIIAGAGFTTGGVAAGSAAAGAQYFIGNVPGGSPFAALQSLGTSPLMTAAVGAAVGFITLAAAWTVVGTLLTVAAKVAAAVVLL